MWPGFHEFMRYLQEERRRKRAAALDTSTSLEGFSIDTTNAPSASEIERALAGTAAKE